ncbi:MAG: transcriptional regulator NrdR [Clostridia bacterium]|nr:transcriptional regulator NrdR [Clostridia bacterium]
MKCPFCEHTESKVLDSRSTEDDEQIRRRRECLKCGSRFTTYEKIEKIPIYVIKRDGTRQIFSREKLLGGLMKACEKRPVPVATLEKAVDEIEAQLYNSLDLEITSKLIGELAMAKLKDIDEVAYVRFASVYRQFADVESFKKELSKLLGEKKYNSESRR